MTVLKERCIGPRLNLLNMRAMNGVQEEHIKNSVYSFHYMLASISVNVCRSFSMQIGNTSEAYTRFSLFSTLGSLKVDLA